MPHKDLTIRRQYNKDYQARRYAANKTAYMAEKKKRYYKISAYFSAYKAERGCITCEENHPGCLDFHHRDKEQKEFAVSDAIKRGWGIARILTEVVKCNIICSNCHRKHHYNERVLLVSSSGKAQVFQT